MNPDDFRNIPYGISVDSSDGTDISTFMILKNRQTKSYPHKISLSSLYGSFAHNQPYNDEQPPTEEHFDDELFTLEDKP